jgi:methionyl aminopeptidase
MGLGMIELKSAAEVERMARSGAIIGALFSELEERVEPGITTLELDRFAEDFIRSHDGAVPLFKGLYGFPGSLCTSVNDEVVHGIPSALRVLAEGDIISIDVGVRLEEWCGDSARTFPVGEIAPEAARLVEVTSRALIRAIAAAVPGNHVGDIGHAVETVVEGTGFEIIRDLVGHGVGRKLHEEPQVPNLGRPGEGAVLREGMVLAIEPMISAGTWRIRTLADRWTMSTADGALSAHCEHTVAVTGDGPRVLTAAGDAVPSIP